MVNVGIRNMESTYNYKAYNGTAPDPNGLVYPSAVHWFGIREYAFGTGTKILLVWVHDNRLVIRFSFDGVAYGDDIILYDAAQAEPFYYSAQKFQVINFVAGSNSVWQVMGQW